mmetsp:Transcript_35178/g.60235  ORF Transcript_35178/g.60235 Transcript_35178/m.60235 type:complete len:203 (+) Transcript_35178:421-1029(+)
MDHLHRLTLGHIEAAGAHPVDDLLRAKAESVGVDRDVLQRPQSAERRAVERVVDHEVMDEEAATGLEGLVGVGVEGRDDALWHGARDVRHEHHIEGGIGDGPVGRGRVELDEVDTLLHRRGLLGLDALAGAADLGQLENSGLEAGRGLGEDVGEGARAAADVEHGRGVAELQLLLDEILRRRHGAVVLRLRVRRRRLRVREP